MYSIDKSNFKSMLINFDKQIQESSKIIKKSSLNFEPKKITNILYLGMGGSAIAGNLLYDTLFDYLKVPVDVVRGYLAPAYCSKQSLVIVSSYSGNTEETLSAAEKAITGKAQFLAVTSGGKLKEMAEANQWSLILIPEGFPPRQALGYIYFTLYHALGNAGLFTDYNSNLTGLIHFIQKLTARCDQQQSDCNILSRELAKTLHGKIPLIYSAAPYLQTCARRWQNQFHENSKCMAFANVLPEMNHNEIVGFEQDSTALSHFIAIFLRDKEAHPRIDKRIELTQKIIKKHGIEIVDIYTEGHTLLEKVFSLILKGDWVSYYLALSHKKDPIKIKNIDFLKSELAKIQ